MIRYDLRCDEGHGFDAWFRSSGDFDAQSDRALLACPSCGSAKVGKALMRPAIGAGSAERGDGAATPSGEVALASDHDRRIRDMLGALKKQVSETSEDVGERFPEVARKMHAEEIEHRSIRGRATADEARALADEGVPIQQLPRFPDDAN